MRFTRLRHNLSLMGESVKKKLGCNRSILVAITLFFPVWLSGQQAPVSSC